MTTHKKSTGARRGPSRTPKKNPWSEEQLTTSTSSRIIDIDLVKLLADPKAWTCLDEDEKKEIIALLPDDIQQHADPGPNAEGQEDPRNFIIPPLPESFVRYSNSWRDAVRQFQFDLQTGRYDPEWQRQAAAAMEERAQGKYDKFKEEQFEEFWGQKQKLDSDVIAGKSSTVKLGTLVENGVVRVGDVWRYSRCFRKGDEKLLLEKEVRIVDRDGCTLTFAIPPGRRVFLYNSSEVDQKFTNQDSQPISDKQSSGEPVRSPAFVCVNTPGNSLNLTVEPKPVNIDYVKYGMMLPGIHQMASADASLELSSAREMAPPPYLKDETQLPATTATNIGTAASEPMVEAVPKETSLNETPGLELSSQQPSRVPKLLYSGDCATDSNSEAAANDKQPKGSMEPALPSSHPNGIAAIACSTVEANSTVGASDETIAEATGEAATDTAPEPTSGQTQESIPKDIIFSGVSGPGRLANKILQIDGRITEPPNGNAWKEFRCFRNNQDMGSLWECRQSWFVKGK
ncbi:hypothetical protein I7I51_00282 [Histoplasma capsulatum]|uniref:DEUBAD domain-containing protein n=1 Tax=Ajellomyces capsulatus TaxID=5037 RepID=A0A8A1MBL7_AJECA|nr:predicted protein [Histoplasma mississippiense (nom. inval.)]EDN08642.1 predicted protein [Histoplasma mississippiense (nom. inval.)]QSS63225.1 hypothetical protein I7I51_00282 [Histoplasma capsulatum]